MPDAQPTIRRTICAAAPSEIRRVLRTVLAVPGQSAPDLESQIGALLTFSRRMRTPLDRAWWWMEGDRCAAACVCVESPGRTAALLLPHGDFLPWEPAQAACWLRDVTRMQAERDLRILQCLVPPEDTRAAAILHHAGFTDLANLLYLEKQITTRDIVGIRKGLDSPKEPPAMDCDWLNYDAEWHPHFASLIAATYEDTEDCPGLSRLRDIEDVLAGHRGSGPFVPSRWQVLRQRDIPLGCILLSENALRASMDISYLGLRKEARGCGWGRRLLQRAFERAYLDGFSKVTLAVDAANAPARRLYDAAGFTTTMTRRALIYVFGPTSGRG